MNRLAWILLGCLLIVLAVAVPSLAAPDRKPRGNSGPAELRAIDLLSLQKEAGVAFGDWSIWRYDQGGESYFLINRKTGLAVYLYWGSNGWVNYRTDNGIWYVLYPTGVPSRQDRRDLNIVPYLAKQPTVRVAPGKYTVKSWTVTVTNDTMEFYTPNVMSQIQFRRHAPEFTHNNRSISGK